MIGHLTLFPSIWIVKLGGTKLIRSNNILTDRFNNWFVWSDWQITLYSENIWKRDRKMLWNVPAVSIWIWSRLIDIIRSRLKPSLCKNCPNCIRLSLPKQLSCPKFLKETLSICSMQLFRRRQLTIQLKYRLLKV